RDLIIFSPVYPALKRWAKLERPCGAAISVMRSINHRGGGKVRPTDACSTRGGQECPPLTRPSHTVPLHALPSFRVSLVCAFGRGLFVVVFEAHSFQENLCQGVGAFGSFFGVNLVVVVMAGAAEGPLGGGQGRGGDGVLVNDNVSEFRGLEAGIGQVG